MRFIDITGKKYKHPIYGEYKVLSRTENKKVGVYYLIRFLNTGFTCEARSDRVKNGLVKDKLYYLTKLTGKVFTNTKGQKYIVLDKDIRTNYYIIKFIDSGYTYSVKSSHILDGNVYDKKGNTLTTYYSAIDNKKYRRRSYSLWKAMLQREKTRKSIVCKEWKDDFWCFYKWIVEQELPKYNVTVDEFETYKKLKKWAIDKDFLIKGNNVYSPSTCLLLPNKFNQDLYYYQHCCLIVKDKKQNVIKINNILDFIKSIGYTIDFQETINAVEDIYND